MKKQLKSIFLATLMVSTAVVSACGKKESGTDTPITPTYENPFVETTNDFHKIEGTLHEVNVDFTNPVGDFVKNGVSQYKLVNVEGNVSSKAISFLREQISAGTGTLLPIDNTGLEEVDPDGHYIILGASDLFDDFGLTMPSFEKLGSTGYYIVTHKNIVFIRAYNAQGYQMGVIAFLREVLGYDMFDEDLVIFEKDGTVMPKMEITERPDIDYRNDDNSMTATARYGMGYSGSSGTLWVNAKGEDGQRNRWVHNLPYFLSAQDKVDHPEWFSDDPMQYQVCYTAHGDRKSYDKMVESIFEGVLDAMEYFPDAENIMISQLDVITANSGQVDRCECKSCNASYDYYGQTMGGSFLMLVNDIADKMKEYLASDEGIARWGEYKVVNIVMLLYHSTLKAPAEHTNDGTYILDENGIGKPMTECFFDENGNRTELKDDNGNAIPLTCHDNVSLFYAPSGADFTHSFYEPSNEPYSSAMKAWAGFNGSFYAWLYEMWYHDYLYPYNSFDTFAETMRFFKEYGTKYIYWEGTWENYNNPSFSKLKTYLGGKFMFDLNADYNALLNKYFKYYFGDAGTYMREYFDSVTSFVRENENTIGSFIQSETIERAFKQGTINTYMELIDKSYNAIAKYEFTNPELYASLKKHILIESLFPRFVLCRSFADTYDEDVIKQMRKEFIDDFYALNNTTHKEHTTIDEIFSQWNVD